SLLLPSHLLELGHEVHVAPLAAEHPPHNFNVGEVFFVNATEAAAAGFPFGEGAGVAVSQDPG
ncbi:hypothetical protein, partial [Serratia marcescens]|uniref:hypothetical protein n=1 Tax=Serratia marcescens TaxID=615 RepID=UPI001954BF85